MEDMISDMPILNSEKNHGFSKKGSFATMASSRELLDLQKKNTKAIQMNKYRGQRMSRMSNSNAPSQSFHLN